MAVAPTGAIYKALKFDNVSSRTYGVYITGEAVYNAPARDVEMITIPGRNGSFALDKGRFENIEVSYPAGIFADTEADFRQAISDFRNFLCSRKGYVRLQDEYNPNEYRMAVYKSGLEVDPAMLKAGEFTITFDCKPQRWLTSGESAVSVTSGDTITNPTLFEAGPLLEVEGYGEIHLNGDEIEIINTTLGEVQLSNQLSFGTSSKTVQLDTSNILSGDRIYVKDDITEAQYIYMPSYGSVVSATVTSSSNLKSAYATFSGAALLHMIVDPSVIDFNYGTSKTVTASASWTVKDNNNATGTVSVTITISYNGNDSVTISFSASTSPAGGTWNNNKIAAFYGDSSVSTLLSSIYIDLDLGEAYGISGDVVLPMNHAVELPATLPTLAPGANTITYDNTITDFKITPRWWRV